MGRRDHRASCRCAGPWIARAYYDDRVARVVHRRRLAARPATSPPSTPRATSACVDRTKDVIKSGGEWISSVELENEIMAHPEVAEAAVIGVPHRKWGERPLACVVLQAGRGRSPKDEIARVPRRPRGQVVAARRRGVHRRGPEDHRSASSPRRTCEPASRTTRCRRRWTRRSSPVGRPGLTGPCRLAPGVGSRSRARRPADRVRSLGGGVRLRPQRSLPAPPPLAAVAPAGGAADRPDGQPRVLAAAAARREAGRNELIEARHGPAGRGRRRPARTGGRRHRRGRRPVPRVEATGTYDADATVVVRNRSQDGGAGGWLVTPLALDGGEQVGVIRGFVGLAADRRARGGPAARGRGDGDGPGRSTPTASTAPPAGPGRADGRRRRGSRRWCSRRRPTPRRGLGRR